MLFQKREKVSTEAKQAGKAAAPPAAEKSEDRQAAQFSQRIAGVFGKMYTAILSVNLQMNVYQIESGESAVAGTVLPVRGYYDAWFDQMKRSMSPDSREKFNENFSRQKLYRSFADGADGVSGVFSMVGPPKEEETITYISTEIRADRIPEQDENQVRCIFYIRPVKVGEIATDSSAAGEEAAPERDWNSIRLRKLLGGMTTFFEYDVLQDSLYIHSEGKRAGELNVMQNYLRTLDTHADWTVFHSDLPVVKKLLADAIKGKQSIAEFRYRVGGVHSEDFHTHRAVCAPVEGGEPKWLVGALADIESEVQKENLKQDIYSHLAKLLSELYTIFEIDMNNGVIYTVRYDETGFDRDAKPIKLNTYITDMISRGVVHEEYAGLYRNWLQPDFLDRKTAKGSYEFECRQKLPGSLEYRWYSEMIYRMEGSRRFLRARRDTTDAHAAQRRKYEIEERDRYVAYNRNMLDTMAGLVEFRNVESGAHIANVRQITKLLLEDVTTRSIKYNLTTQQIEILCEAATMHDIGKIVVPDYILNKPSRLTEEEREIMKRHTTDGARIVDRLHLPGQEELIAACRDVALHHHERFDGSGYPEGLVGDGISIGAQAVSVADVYDALVSARCYKKGMAYQEAYDIIMQDGKNGKFNPIIIESFQACYEKIKSINQPGFDAPDAAENQDGG